MGTEGPHQHKPCPQRTRPWVLRWGQSVLPWREHRTVLPDLLLQEGRAAPTQPQLQRPDLPTWKSPVLGWNGGRTKGSGGQRVDLSWKGQ